MNVKLTLGRMAHGCRILLDGVDVSEWVSDAKVHAGVGCATVVELTLSPVEVEIEGDAGAVFARRFSCEDPSAPLINLVATE